MVIDAMISDIDIQITNNDMIYHNDECLCYHDENTSDDVINKLLPEIVQQYENQKLIKKKEYNIIYHNIETIAETV